MGGHLFGLVFDLCCLSGLLRALVCAQVDPLIASKLAAAAGLTQLHTRRFKLVREHAECSSSIHMARRVT